MKVYKEDSIRARLEDLDSAQSPQPPSLTPRIQRLVEELHSQEKADQDRLWVVSRDSLSWSVLDLLPPEWQTLTAEMRYLDGENRWHPDHIYLTDQLARKPYQDWIRTSRVWLIAVQPSLPGQPTTLILVASQVPPSPGDHLSLVSFPTFWECTSEGEEDWVEEEVTAEFSLTVLWPALRLSQDDLAAVAPGAIQGKGLFLALKESRLALAAKAPGKQ